MGNCNKNSRWPKSFRLDPTHNWAWLMILNRRRSKKKTAIFEKRAHNIYDSPIGSTICKGFQFITTLPTLRGPNKFTIFSIFFWSFQPPFFLVEISRLNPGLHTAAGRNLKKLYQPPYVPHVQSSGSLRVSGGSSVSEGQTPLHRPIG